MSIVVAVPIFRVSCKVGIDRGRAWSVIEETLLWSVWNTSKAISDLIHESNLPAQIIVAAIGRLMRFRLVEVEVVDHSFRFRASQYGAMTIASGEPLPFFPKRIPRRVSFVIEWATGEFFSSRSIRIVPPYKLDELRSQGTEVRVVSVEGGGPSMSHEANLNRLSDIATRGLDEQIALVDGRTAVMRDDEFMLLRVVDGTVHGLPERSGAALREVVDAVAKLPAGTQKAPVTYAGPRESIDLEPVYHQCEFDLSDLIVGGSAQRACLTDIISRAQRRVIIHSTFLDSSRFEQMQDMVRSACVRGVKFDLLWGAEKDEETEARNVAAASRIAQLVREDRYLRGSFVVHMRTTGSHCKLILADTVDDGWIAGIGSCNWLSSPFQSVELTAVLRQQHVVADIAHAMQRLVGRRGLSDSIANEMAILYRDLRRRSKTTGNAKVAIIVGDVHDRILRSASGAAQRRFLVGCHRLGSTARPGALMPGQLAAQQNQVQATLLYTQTTGPLKNRHIPALAEEASANGVRLIKTKKIPLHGKFLAWDDDDVLITSVNWASAASDSDFPWGEIGVHINSPGISEDAVKQLEATFPMLVQ